MFVFGGDTGISYEQLQQRRKMAEGLRQQNARTPRNAGEGLNAVARALVARGVDRQNVEVEADMRQDLTRAYEGLFQGGGGYSAPDVAGAPLPSGAGPSAGGASVPDGDTAGYIRSGLTQRGLPEHVADAFLLNFQDESGLNPGINEAKPLVPGSRGGFGLYQLTGPRRVAYEKFAEQRGVAPSNIDAQLDFLMTELQGPEARAAQAIFSAGDTGTAAAAIVNKFLRPSEEHRARRASKYTGGQASAPRSGGGVNPSIAKIAGLLNHPMLPPGQKAVLSAMLQRQMAAGQPLSPLQQQQMELNQIKIDQARQPAPGYSQKTGAELGMQGDAAGMLFNVAPDGKISQIGGGGTSVTVNNGEPQPNIGTIPQGYAAIKDPNEPSGYRMSAIPGGPEDSTEANAARTSARDTASDVVTTAASRALGAARERQVGGLAGGLASLNPSSQNAELYRQVSALKSISSAEALNAMRRQSKTGGALGNVTEKELKLLSEQGGALDPMSPNFERDLHDYTRALLRTVHGREAGDEVFQTQMGDTFQARGEGETDKFSAMSRAELLEVDIMTLDPSEFDAFERALSGGQ